MDSSAHNSTQNKSGVCMCFNVCRMWCWKAFKWIPVMLITSIVIWSYYAYVIQLCIFTLSNTVQQCVYLILFHIILFMFVWSYARTIFAEIKPVPDRFKLPETEIEKLLSAESEDDQRSILENFAKDLPVVTRTTSGSVRYCNRCVLIKPDRAHHCSICARCVLKMDHHCPWVNNCVCFFNYKFFMLFLGYALLYCLFITFTCLPYFVKFWKSDISSGGTGRYHIVFAFFVALMFAISLGSLFGYHCFLVAKNRTTLDMLVAYGRFGRPVKRMVQSIMNLMVTEAFRAPMFRGGSDRDGFSIGCFNNFKEVFGNRPNLWLVPVFTSTGDGCTFPVRREHELQAFTAPAPLEPHGYESMGTTRSSFGDGVVFPLPAQDEDTESLLSSEQWDRWGERARPFDERESSSYDEL